MITQKADLPTDRHAEFDAIVDVLHAVRGPFSILMQSPGLAQKVMEAGLMCDSSRASRLSSGN